mgnify:CR=1 FL=1
MEKPEHLRTGRRKTSTARVFLNRGSGNISVNGKPLDEYFGRVTGRMLVRQPLDCVNMLENFDIKVTVSGGGNTGQAGAMNNNIRLQIIKMVFYFLCFSKVHPVINGTVHVAFFIPVKCINFMVWVV